MNKPIAFCQFMERDLCVSCVYLCVETEFQSAFHFLQTVERVNLIASEQVKPRI